MPDIEFKPTRIVNVAASLLTGVLCRCGFGDMRGVLDWTVARPRAVSRVIPSIPFVPIGLLGSVALRVEGLM